MRSLHPFIWRLSRGLAAAAFALTLLASQLALAQFAQQGDKLVYSTSSNTSLQGFSVALSADGNTALVGAPSQTGGGAAFVYTRSAGVWSEQAALVASNKIGTPQFGVSVSLSADGDTAIVGGNADDSNAGAAWIFSRSGSSWGTGTKLIGSGAVGSARQGSAVAISANGQYAVVGGNSDDGNKGAGWIWFRDNGAWTQQTKLPAATGMSGNAGIGGGGAAAISGNGDTVILGGRLDNSSTGAAWLYVRDGTAWSQQGDKLVGSGISVPPSSGQGIGVALSNDGNTALVGGYQFNNAKGAAWAFTRSGTVWSEQARIGPNVGNAWAGYSVALSSDGNTAMLGARNQNSTAGGAYIYVRVAGSWSLQGGSLVGTNASSTAQQGTSVALSADAGTALSGGFNDSTKGAAWVFVQMPTVTAITPDTGSASGGTSVTITGTGFTGADLISNSVQIDSAPASSVVVVDPNHMTAVTGANTPGTFDVNVTNAIGTGTGAGLFTYVPPPAVTGISPVEGAGVGGTSVVITGTGFTADSVVKFGAVTASSTFDSATQITATSPGNGLGVVDVTVITPGGTTATSAADQFTYLNPTITSVSPASGPILGGNTIVITGTRLDNVTGVTMGGCDASASITANTATSVSFTSTACNPTPYTPDITVTTAEGSATVSGAYTYVKFPHVTGITPSAGHAGTEVVLTGSFLDGAQAVTFGTTAGLSVGVDGDGNLVATAPAHAAGPVNVTVTTAGGTSTETATFTYIAAPTVTAVSPASGALGGNTTVTITGTNLTGATGVKFGGSAATNVAVVNATTVTAKTPAHAAGAVTVEVTTQDGTGSRTSAFTYAAAPTITAINPNQGPAAGGTLVSITGTNLTGATGVKFGTTAATSFSAASPTKATATAPVHAAGAVNVTIITPSGTSATGAGNKFTYTPTPQMTAVAKFAGGVNDGGKPFGGLVADASGAMYGTTSIGGKSNKGTVFKLTPSGKTFTKTILHHFTGASGATPYAGLAIDGNKNLYGVTTAGGSKSKGVIFKLTAPNYAQSVLYNFKGDATDGGNPYAALARDGAGVLYGATTTGGSKGLGTTFTLTGTTYKVTHHFTGGADGDNPHGALILDASKNVFGTTLEGGAPALGTIYKLAPNGTRTILHTFATSNDGKQPYGGLFMKGTALFGTTFTGGSQNKGSVFEIMPPSTATTPLLFSFTGVTGANPYAGVVADAATILYGTTFNGGAQNKGAVFQLIPPANGQTTWSESVMYSFLGGANNAANPYAPLLLGKTAGTLFGTTSAGGNAACPSGCGTVFKLAY
jgi:uncharacterized repeat protein (TIGR03803 family)